MNPGSLIAHYRITAKLGEGGMGAVWRATDTKLGRDIAIKTLPPQLASDADYLARFQREAQVLASLNHPNIAAVYGLEENAIIMELVEGLELKGPLPPGEVTSIAKQIADALEAAHDRGIIHRDLKPGNIKITPDGTVKVLDFGLAKTAEPAVAATASAQANSPTLTLHATQAGFILGTAAYMAPEQAAGKPVDRRADIWAFGVVLWELITGRQLFQGETVSHTLAAVLKDAVDLTPIPEGPVRTLIARCLDRNPKTRLGWIGEARAILDTTVRPEPTKRAQPLLWQAAAVLSLGLAAFAGWAWYASRDKAGSDRPLLQFNDLVGRGLSLRDAVSGPTAYTGSSFVISRDGRRIVFVASTQTKPPQLYTRRLDEPVARPLEGTEGAALPFLSPDGEWAGFVSNGQIRKVRLDGGTPMSITGATTGGGEIRGVLGASWGDDGNIIFHGSSRRAGLLRVSNLGGEATPVTSLLQGENTHRWPQVLPGSRVVLFSAGRAATMSEGRIDVQRLDTGERKTIVPSAHFGRYLPSGHLLYVKQGTLYAVRFDPDALRVDGSPVPVIQNLRSAPDSGGAQFDVSDNGIALFRTMDGVSTGRRLYRIFPDGRSEPLPTPGGGYASPELSPDGKRIAVHRREGDKGQLWVYDLSSGTGTRLAWNHSTVPGRLVWTPDGQRVAFTTAAKIFWTAADGSGEPTRLVESAETASLIGITPDGHTLIYFEPISGIWRVSISGSPGKPEKLPGYERITDGRLSPDGRWIAYRTQSAAPQEDVFVRSYGGPEGKWQISTSGGSRPVWSPDGKRLFYFGGTVEQLMVAPFSVTGSTFVPGPSSRWTNSTLLETSRNVNVSPDGKSLILIADESSRESDSTVSILLHFTDELKRRLP